MTSVSFRDAVKGAVVQRCWLVTLDFKDQTIRVFQGEGGIEVPGLGIFTGLGKFAQLSTLKQPVGGSAPAMSIGLSGVDKTTARLARKADELVKGYIARIHLGVWSNDGSFVGYITPVTAIMDRMTYAIRTEGGDGEQQPAQVHDITIALESIIGSRRTKPSYATYTDADQQARFPGDLICEFGGLIGHKTYQWPNI